MNYTVSGIVSDETLSRIIDIESAGKSDAKAKTSSATGLAQFINSTWLATLKEHRPDLFNGPPYDDELALRMDPAIAIELLARLTEDNATALGRNCTDGDLYLAHFAGIATAKKVMQAKPSASTTTVFTQKQIDANRSILQGKTCGEVRAWASRKMAKARTDWVSIYWTQPKGKPEREPERPAPDDPGPAPEPDEDPAPVPAPPRRQPDDPGVAKPSLWHRLKRWLGWGTGAAGGGGILTYFTSVEFLIIAAVTIVVVILIVFGVLLYLFGKERVRDYLARIARKMVPE